MLWDALTAPEVAAGRVTLVASDRSEELSWGDVVELGGGVAARLRARGVGRGDRVALVLTNSRAAIASLAGVWFAGASVLSLPTLGRGMSVEAYRAQLARLCGSAGTRLLVADAPVAGVVRGIPVEVLACEDLVGGAEKADPDPPGADDVAFVQFSSGTTGEPRGAALTPRAIAAQLGALAEAVAVDPGRDRVVAWLPLSHDMGLFGCLLLSWFTGMPLLLGTPLRFLAAPATWLDDCAACGATLSVVPPSVLPAVARADRGGPGLSLRACIVGGERIPAQALDMAQAVLDRRGTPPTVLTPAYGLAEATLAVTVAPLGERPRVLAVDETALWEGKVVPAADADADASVRVVSCGPSIEGTSVAIAGGGQVGEVVVRSRSLASGYLADTDATQDTFAGGELRTHDIGFLENGELYPLARSDDVLNVGGRRINSTAVEDSLGSHRSLRSGSCVIVDIASDQSVRFVVLAELSEHAPSDLTALAHDVRRESLSAGGPPIDECLFVKAGEVPKTPSGKIQRFRAREIAAHGRGRRVRVRNP